MAAAESHVFGTRRCVAVKVTSCVLIDILREQFMMNIAEFAKFLETYSGRDKVIRLLCYSAKLGAGVSSSPVRAQKLDKFSSQLSACRALLRLFDDIPMLNCTLTYGLGRKEKDNVLRFLDLTSNVIDQAYFPIEHVAWAIENDFMSVKSNPWSTSSTVFWVISIYLSLMSTAMPQLLIQQQNYLLSTFKCSLDLVHAVNCLPEGYLWGGKLLKWQVGAVGTVSSVIGLYMALKKKSS
ncbi:Peroxisomal membrane protein 11C [Gryllus bimaculatus]|nr:Peroxisomal membrane protein 11C [Gryllus bimaculatus]